MTTSRNHINTATEVRCDEKDDMRKLNDKLAIYVQKVRQIGGASADSAAFLSSIQCVEDEVNKLRALYEAELDSLRQQLDAACREKNIAVTESEKYRRMASEVDERYRAECEKNARLISEINSFQMRIAELEKELANARSAAQVPQTHLHGVQNDLKQAFCKNEELSRQLEVERARAKQLQDKVSSLQQKIDFNEQRHIEQMRDTSGRLDQSKSIISSLEIRSKELESQQSSVPQMVEEMRRKTETEIASYKSSCEADYNKNITTLRHELESQRMAIESLKAAYAALQADHDKLEGNNRTLHSQIKDLKAQKAILEDLVNKERARGAEQIRMLERKLKDLQDLLFARMQEMNVNREIQVSLRSEIESMRVILEEEERRLGSSGLSKSFSYSTKRTSDYATPAPATWSSTANLNQGSTYMYTDAELKSKSKETKVGGATSLNVGGVANARYANGAKGPTEYTTSYNRGGTGNVKFCNNTGGLTGGSSGYATKESAPHVAGSWSGPAGYQQQDRPATSHGVPNTTGRNSWTPTTSRYTVGNNRNGTTYQSAYCGNTTRYAMPRVY